MIFHTIRRHCVRGFATRLSFRFSTTTAKAGTRGGSTEARCSTNGEGCSAVLTAFVDFKSVECYLAIPNVLELASQCSPPLLDGLRFEPFEICQTEFGRVADTATGRVDVSTVPSPHYTRKNQYLYRTLSCEATRLGLPLHPPRDPDIDTTPALAGLMFLSTADTQLSELQHRRPHEVVSHFVLGCFASVFGKPDSGLTKCAVSDPVQVQRLVSEAADSVTLGEAFAAWWTEGDRLSELHQQRAAWVDRHHLFSAPSFLLGFAADDEVDSSIHTSAWHRDKHLIADGKQELFTGRWSLYLLETRLRLEQHLPPRAVDEIGPQQVHADTKAGCSGNIAVADVQVDCYMDIKSPYAYLSTEPIRQLRATFPMVNFNFLPFVLDIPSFFGSARVGKERTNAKVQPQGNRSNEQWRAVRYLYADVRRRAALRQPPLRILGTQKIWDSSLEGMALLWIRQNSPERVDAWMDTAWPRFWNRQLDVEDAHVLAKLMESDAVRVDSTGFVEWTKNEGNAMHSAVRNAAWNDLGIFGAPTIVVRSGGAVVPPSPLWGAEHIPAIRQLLRELIAEGQRTE